MFYSNWPKPLHYVLTDKINASIRIGIWRLLASFVTSLISASEVTTLCLQRNVSVININVNVIIISAYECMYVTGQQWDVTPQRCSLRLCCSLTLRCLLGAQIWTLAIICSLVLWVALFHFIKAISYLTSWSHNWWSWAGLFVVHNVKLTFLVSKLIHKLSQIEESNPFWYSMYKVQLQHCYCCCDCWHVICDSAVCTVPQQHFCNW